MVGGVFGLLGGYLTDRLGRRRVLTFSILLYALSAFAAGFVTSLPQLLVLRCAVFVGVCVEFVAAVAWLAELFEDPKQREKVLGYTQAFSSVGGILVAVANVTAASIAAEPARDPRRARGVALHADLRRDPGAAADRHPAVPAGVAGVGGQARGRPAAAPEHRRAVRSRPGAHDDRHDDRLRRELRHRLRRDPAAAADPRRAEPRPRRDRRASPSAARQQAIADAAAKGQPPPPEPRLRQIAGNATDQAVATVSSLAGDGRPRRPRRVRAHRGLGHHAGARCCGSSRSRR